MKFLFMLTGIFVLPLASHANAELMANPGSVFMSGNVGGFSAPSEIYVMNEGNEVAEGVSVMSTCYGEFSSVNACFGNLSPGQSCNITVNFTPRTVGLQTCEIQISSSNGGFANVLVEGQAYK
jgi:hypothetical protein